MPHWMKNKLFNGQRPNKETMLILFLSGILIFVILLPVDKAEVKITVVIKIRMKFWRHRRAVQEVRALRKR